MELDIIPHLSSFKPTVCISLDELNITEADTACENVEKELREEEIVKIDGI